MNTRTPSRWWIVPFGAAGTSFDPQEEPSIWLGEEGATWLRLARARLPVLPGFIITSEVCGFFCRHGGRYPPGVWDRIRQELERLSAVRLNEHDTGPRPLWLRWIPLPPRGLELEGFDPVVLGLNESTIQQFATVTGTEAPAWRAYARLIRAYAVGALGQAPEEWAELWHSFLQRCGVGSATLLDSKAAREWCAVLLRRFTERTRRAFPRELTEQLRGFLTGLYERWKACGGCHRRRTVFAAGIPVALTWAAFGDMDEQSARCVLWSRDPIAGTAGVRGCLVTDDTVRDAVPEQGLPVETLEQARSANLRSALWNAFRIVEQAELVTRRPQQLEVVIERSRVWIASVLPCRRTPHAAVRWAVELVTGRDLYQSRSVPKLWTVEEALSTLDPRELAEVMETAGRSEDLPSPAGVTLIRWAAERHHLDVVGLWDGTPNPIPDWVRRHLRAVCVTTSLDESPPIPRFERRCRSRVLWWLKLDERRARGDADSAAIARSLHARAENLDSNGPRLAEWLGRIQAPRKGAIEIVVDPEDFGDVACERFRWIRESLEKLAPRLVIHLRLSIPRAVLAADAAADWTAMVWFDLAHLDALLRGPHRESSVHGERSFDPAGVGLLIETGWQRLRTVHPGIRGGLWLQTYPEPALIRFAQRLGLCAIACPLAWVGPTHIAIARTASRFNVVG